MREKKGQIVFILILALDQLLKFIALKNGTAFINKGISFGLFENPLSKGVFLLVLPLLLFIFFLVSVYKFPGSFGLVLMLSGGLSNYLDRIVRAGVVDWLKTGFFPSFNLADFSITVGFVLFLVDFVKKQTVS